MSIRSSIRRALICAGVVVITGCGRAEPAPRNGSGAADGDAVSVVDPAFEGVARAAAARLRTTLQQELSSALSKDGPVAAIEICRTRAPEIAGQVGALTGLDVRRVATRNRNPENRADPVEEAVLAAFAARPALAETLFVRDGQTVYMQPIRIGSPACLNCHGPDDSIGSDVKAVIAAHYPDDRATGFAAGDLRGAFVVRSGP